MKNPTRKNIGTRLKHKTYNKYGKPLAPSQLSTMELILYSTLSCPEFGRTATNSQSTERQNTTKYVLVEDSQTDQDTTSQKTFELLEKYGDLNDIEDFI